MGLVESNAVLFTASMETKDTLDEYYCVFKAQVDTTEAHSSSPWYHGVVDRIHCKATTVNKGHNTAEKLAVVGDTDIQKMRAEALKSSAGAYLRCFVFMMMDKRYKLLNKFVREAFLAEK